MMILFYISGCLAIVSTVCVLFNVNPIHALLFLITSFMFVSLNLFSLQAPFAALIEMIIYAGAIMVLFIFVIMMINIKHISLNLSDKISQFLSVKMCCGVLLLMSNLLILLLLIISKKDDCLINITQSTISIKNIGSVLFGSYMIVIEMASFLLLGALISVLHLAQERSMYSNFNFVQLSEHKK